MTLGSYIAPTQAMRSLGKNLNLLSQDMEQTMFDVLCIFLLIILLYLTSKLE